GTPLGNASSSSAEARVEFIRNPRLSPQAQRKQLDLVRQMNQEHLDAIGPAASLEARTAAFELAFRMQTEMPHAIDLSQETAATHQRYGLDNDATRDFGRQCLMARR